MSGAAGGGAAMQKGFITNTLDISGTNVTLTTVVNELLADVPRWDLIKDGTSCQSSLENRSRGLGKELSGTILSMFRKFGSDTPVPVMATSKALKVFRENFINSLSVGDIEAQSYDPPIIEVAGEGAAAAAGGGDVKMNTLTLKTLVGIKTYYDAKPPKLTCDTCKRRKEGSFGDEEGGSYHACIDVPIKTDNLGYQIDNMSYLSCRVPMATPDDDAMCSKVEDVQKVNNKIEDGNSGQNARIFMNRIAKYMDGVKYPFADFYESVHGCGFKKAIFKFTLPVTMDGTGGLGTAVKRLDYELEFTFEDNVRTSTSRLIWDRLKVSVDGTILYNLELNKPIHDDPPSGWATEIAAAVENAYLLQLHYFPGFIVKDGRGRGLYPTNFQRSGVGDFKQGNIEGLKNSKLLVQKIKDIAPSPADAQKNLIIMSVMFLKTISDELMSAPCFATVSGHGADGQPKQLISATTDQIYTAYVLSNQGPVVSMVKSGSIAGMVNSALGYQNAGTGNKTYQELINNLNSGNLPFNKYGLMVLLNNGTPPPKPTKDQLNNLVTEILKSFRERAAFYGYVSSLGTEGILTNYKTTQANISKFQGFLNYIKGQTDSATVSGGEPEELDEVLVQVYRILSYMVITNINVLMLPPKQISSVKGKLNSGRTPRIAKILAVLTNPGGAGEDFNPAKYIQNENDKFSEIVAQIGSLIPAGATGGRRINQRGGNGGGGVPKLNLELESSYEMIELFHRLSSDILDYQHSEKDTIQLELIELKKVIIEELNEVNLEKRRAGEKTPRPGGVESSKRERTEMELEEFNPENRRAGEKTRPGGGGPSELQDEPFKRGRQEMDERGGGSQLQRALTATAGGKRKTLKKHIRKTHQKKRQSVRKNKRQCSRRTRRAIKN